MPSPNGYISDFSYLVHDRQSFRVTLDHDVNSPPWLPGQAGSYTLVWETGPTAAGPWTAAPLTDLATGCTPQPDNETTVGGITNTLVRTGDPTPGTGTTADTDYFVRVTVLDPTDVQVDQWVLDTPAHTFAYPVLDCIAPSDVTETSGTANLATISGRLNISAPCNQDTVVWEIATTPGGPYTPAPAEPNTDFTPSHTFTGLTAGTTYYYRARFTEQAETAAEYLVTPECSFTTEEAAVTTPPFSPQPCDAGGGADAVDVEQIVLCDLDAEGNLLGTALAVYEYDSTGAPTGAPTFVDPATGDPYVAQGTLQPCPDAACLPPMQFCQTSTTTGPVDHPGRQYDITLPINPGFAVQSLQVDAVSHPAGITWEVDDPDGEVFRQNLTAFMEGRVPAAATVTITNPNAGTPQVCGAALPMQVHIECLRLDQAPPNLIELVYNGGQDLIQNPAYNEFPALNPPVSQGNYGFRLLSRQDDPGPFPINQPANDALCTSVANRGWETNDVGRTFEIWGQDIVNGENVTPTPRGTPVQEMTSDGAPPGGVSTIWQTFQAPASGSFVIRVVHGSRDPGETHRITLDNGDTDDAQNGDLIDDTTNPPSVTNAGGPNPWTQFTQTIPLNAGSTYTLALSSTNPVVFNRGGLFTDMRAYIDRPDQRATATTDDDTCVVTVEETTTNTTCSFWQPQCGGGAVVGWQKVDTGETLTNAAFWAQVPTPSCCLPETEAGEGGSTGQSNMLTSDTVCATVGGVPQNAIRIVVTDPSGGTLLEQFIGSDGAPIAPDSWTAGPCTTSRYMADQVLCDDNGPFLRKYVQSLDATNQAQVNSFRDFTLAGAAYTPVGTVENCAGDCTSCQTLTLCDFGADEPVLITGISTGGTLSNGVTWSGARGSAALFNPQHNNADGSWWGMPSFPNATVAPDTWFFDRPVDVEFSVVIAHSPSTGSGLINQVQVPIGAELVSAAPDYSYDVATGIVTVDDSNTGDCTKVTNPTVANSARFRLRNVTQFTLDFLGQRIAICNQFSNWRFGSIAVTPATSTFLRTICRDCEGAITTVTDTQADGVTPYTPIGPVGECGTAADAEPQCFATQICVQPQGTQEFISNEANLTSTVGSPNIDPVWQWSNDPVAGPWFNMYDVGVFPGWFTVDPGTTEGVANWVAPHPNSSPITSGLPGEGPTIGPGNAEWYARAQFTLPADADPASIRIAATVINADQLGVEFRLNDGAWQPVNASHVDPPFSFPAQVIPGAQAGLNEVFVHVRETVFGSGAAGVKMHLIASYNLGDQQSWTQIVCDDGTVSYFTNAGEQADALPDNWVIVPCGASGDAESCTTASSIGTVCYTPPVAVQTLQDDWTGATSVLGGGSRVWTNPNFAGQGITVTETVTPDTGATLAGGGVRNSAISPASQHTVIDLGAPRTNVTVRMDFFGSNQGERLRNVTPAFTSVSGNGTAVLANTGVDGGPAADGTIFLTFPGPVQTISWDYAPTGNALSAQSFISFNTGNASNSAPAAVLRDCNTGETTYVDLATGTVLDPAVISIVDCPGATGSDAVDRVDAESQILCDANGTRFLRTYAFDAAGVVTGFTDRTLAGAVFAPVGAVGICTTPVATDLDFVVVELCDDNGGFLRRFTFNSATGAVTATTNTTLAGAAYVPVGTVGICDGCCPAVVGEGCTNTGSGRYTAIRATNGTITLIDSVSGATVLAANIVPCTGDDTVRTLTAQGRLVGDADAAWTPGADVAGTLTSVTLTVLSGTATVTDANGTVMAGLPAGYSATWNAEDDNVLTGPQSIDAVGGSTAVVWTER